MTVPVFEREEQKPSPFFVPAAIPGCEACIWCLNLIVISVDGQVIVFNVAVKSDKNKEILSNNTDSFVL
jgi:hypothetical protein